MSDVLNRKAFEAGQIQSQAGIKQTVDAYTESLKRLQDPADRLRTALEFKKTMDKVSRFERSKVMMGAEAALRGQEKEFDASFSEGLEKGGELAVRGLGAIVDVVDYPTSKIREMVSGSRDAQQFLNFVRKNMPNAARAFDVVGTPLGLLGASLGAVPAAGAQLLTGSDPAAVWDTLREYAYKDAPQMGGDFLMLMAADPLTYMSFGTGSTSKALGRQLAKSYTLSGGSSGVKMAKLMKEADQVALKGGVNFTDNVAALVSKWGIKSDVAEKIMGKNFSRAGLPGLEIGLPFGPKTELQNILPILPEQVGRRIFEKIGGKKLLAKMKKKAGGHAFPELNPIEEKAFLQELNKVRHSAVANSLRQLDALEKEMATVGQRIKPAKIKEILKHEIDPEYDLNEVETVADGVIHTASGFLKVIDGRTDDAFDPAYVHFKAGNMGLADKLAAKRGPMTAQDIRGYNGNRYVLLDPNSLNITDAGTPGAKLFQINKSGPSIKLNDAEQRFVGIVSNYLDGHLKELKNAEILDEATQAYNLYSGYYVPRRFKGPKTGIFGEPLESFQRGSFGLKKRRTGQELPGGPRGTALGGVSKSGREAELDLDEILVKYTAQAERAKSKKYFDRVIADKFNDAQQPGKTIQMKNSQGERVHVPANVANELRKAADGQFMAFHANILDKAMNYFKTQVLLPVPRYHLVNVISDNFLMFFNGMQNPNRFRDAAKVWKKGNLTDTILVDRTGKKWSRGELQKMLQDNGIGAGSPGRFDIDPLTNTIRPGRLEKGRRKGAGEFLPGFRADPKATAKEAYFFATTGAGKQVGQKIASEWDKLGKTSFFLDRLAKGDSPTLAISKTYEVLFDYSDQDKLLHGLRKFMPFATWQYKALKAVPRTIIRNPSAVTVTQKLAVAAGDKDRKKESRRFQGEMSSELALNENHRELVSAFTRAVMGRGLDKGYGVSISVRDPVSEALSPYVEAARGNWRPLGQMFNPVVKSVIELMTEQDLFTGRDLQRPQATRPFTKGSPVASELEEVLGLAPGWLQADRGQFPWIDRVVPPFLASPIAIWIGNEALRRKGAKNTVWGPSRDYSRDPEIQSAMQFLNMLTAARPTPTLPSGPIQDILQTNEFQRVLAAPGEQKHDIIQSLTQPSKKR